MYSIANIIYGVPLTETAERYCGENEIDYETLGFRTLYSGSADYTPAYLGIKITSIDECSGYQKLDMDKKTITDSRSSFTATITAGPNETARINKAVSDLPQGLRELLPNPGIYIVWSTS